MENPDNAAMVLVSRLKPRDLFPLIPAWPLMIEVPANVSISHYNTPKQNVVHLKIFMIHVCQV